MSATRTQTTPKKTRLKSTEDGSSGIWSQLLDGVGSGKRLAEKNVLILGGSPETQRDFLDTLAQDAQRRGGRGQFGKRAPVANRFALGYTYQDILDADQDDILARLSLYMLSNPKMSYTTLLEPLLTPKTIPHTLVVILLDWSHPWTWMRELRTWTRILRATLSGLDVESKEPLEENTKEWSERRRGPSAEGVAAADRPTSSEGPANLPLGPGEYDEHLGLPLCVVAQGAEKIENYEKDHHWGDEEFDTILQYLRAALLKHGGSLIYSNSSATAVATTAAPAPNDANAPQTGPAVLQSLVRGSLDIHSLLQKNALKHNVIDRDRIVVPPNWDSWGKIRVLREGFDVESVSDAWSYDIQVPKVPAAPVPAPIEEGAAQTERPPIAAQTPDELLDHALVHESPKPSAVTLYEAAVRDPNPTHDINSTQKDIDTHCPPNQDFFTTQSVILDKLKAEDDAASKAREARQTTSSTGTSKGPGQQGTASTGNAARDIGAASDAKVSEHIGPVQFNMGGIQVDADDALKSLRNAAAARNSQATAAKGSSTPAGRTVPLFSPTKEKGESEAEGEDEQEDENEKLKSFFAGLVTKSNAGTPKGKSESGSGAGGASTPSRS